MNRSSFHFIPYLFLLLIFILPTLGCGGSIARRGVKLADDSLKAVKPVADDAVDAAKGLTDNAIATLHKETTDVVYIEKNIVLIENIRYEVDGLEELLSIMKDASSNVINEVEDTIRPLSDEEETTIRETIESALCEALISGSTERVANEVQVWLELFLEEDANWQFLEEILQDIDTFSDNAKAVAYAISDEILTTHC